ncbi:bacillithiol biosynthesis cysteine-adding enzyme BshC [Cnuella takakiae]|uniref:Putative cysteine ligase BshC n=1 Tax=Cnuella takakiae TaxID=1302690 RepID=A0A1M5GCI4_9BACT|nr:bacillithiol biosynthesis cysteine-adding enzyme BshC [Cnuella takakiae]OLY92367.1 bacillithiol biosynthesis cysteine-adding enzyme BshC [Cnuella takakiae]SHG01388.1 bacillithiol biosynthesis cysteine-adding enzyme BshC [Cnuella takakiae]
MPFSAYTLPYDQTNSFSRIVLDYLQGAAALKPFYAAPPTPEGLAQVLAVRRQKPVNREVLATVLQQQYAGMETHASVVHNIEALQDANTFTVCTAHQPNLFTGPLYFLYKILHAIRLAAQLEAAHPGSRFVPVYYMGSEDADLDELNHFSIQGKRYTWQTDQKGAVGRMVIDNAIQQLIHEVEGQLAPFEQGKAIAASLRRHFAKGNTIQQATFALVNKLFGSFGLIVLIPDSASLKALMLPVFEQELFAPVSGTLVGDTSERLAAHYNVQAHPREINLFYLEGDIRERIIREGDDFLVNNTALRFSAAEMKVLIQQHPERLSPNVILRGLFQETILPNIAFIGGGGELAYWLQLKDLFEHYDVSFPVLVLRNSFLLLEEKWQERIDRLGFSVGDCFQKTDNLVNLLARRQAEHPLTLNGKMEQAEALFEAIRSQASAIDPTLSAHVAALKAASLKKLKVLEQKMLRAEKRKHADSRRQIEAIRQQLFPGDGLQERVDSFLYYYAVYGPQLIADLYQHSGALEQQFTILPLSGEA